MKLDRLSFWGLAICLCVVAGCAAEGPEEVCRRWVAASCENFAGCCTAGDDFNGLQCQRDMWATCLETLRADAVRRGEADFDRTAADDCLAPITACNLGAPVPEKQILACRNASTGHVAPGEACSRASDCRRPEAGYAECYEGVAENGAGVCASVVVATDGKCGFAADTHVRSVCPAGQFCDVSALVPPGSIISGAKPIYAFSADCKPLPGAGQPCLTPIVKAVAELVCDRGLQCGDDPTGATIDICKPRKARGEACDTSSECADGLACTYEPSTCQGADDVAPYCYVPPGCGNGFCEADETLKSCEKDCAICGDGVCSASETPADCPSDCPICGDGFCDVNESNVTCRDDCPVCGDDYCSPAEKGTGCPDCLP